jgi:hypothetical protein
VGDCPKFVEAERIIKKQLSLHLRRKRGIPFGKKE